jgi:hypothetical protein
MKVKNLIREMLISYGVLIALRRVIPIEEIP